jgi:hypothetical protein
MANQKEKNALRERTLENMMNSTFEGLSVLGRTTEGVLLHETDEDLFIVLKAIVKKEGFDAEDALAEFVEKEKAREEREKEKAKKLAEKGE